MDAIDFVGDNIYWLAKCVQKLTNLSVGTNHTSTSINDEYNDIGFVNRSMRLFRHIIIDVTATIIRLTDTTSVYNNERLVFISSITVLTVTSQS